MAGLALLTIKWLTITALLLAVPFALWWSLDRRRRSAAPAAVPAPVPLPVPAATPVPARVRRSAAPAGTEPATAPIPVPRRARPLTVVPSPRGVTREELLAADRAVVVTREEDHQEVLAAHHRPGRRAPTPVTVELWSSTVTRGKHRGDFAVEIRLDGRRVGELTAAMSARYRHLVDVAGPVRCRGTVTHDARRGFQVDLRLPDVV